MTKSIETMRRRVLVAAALAFGGLAASASAKPPPPWDANACWERMYVFCASNWQAFGYPDYDSCVQAMGQEICNGGGPQPLIALRPGSLGLQSGEW